jgi:hypothetical protein
MLTLDRRSHIILWIGIFILLAGAQVVAVAYGIKHSARDGVEPTIPVEEKPEALSVYTGEPITKRTAQKRALGVMIAGDPITRPQSGLAEADVVVEMEAAPGITRFLALFQSVFPEEIGSVRSARNDYIDLAEGFDSVLVHWGGEKKALDRLAVSDAAEIDQFANGDLFYRKPGIPSPHDGFTTAELMLEGLKRYDYARPPTFSAWDFMEDGSESTRPLRGTLSVIYGNPDFNVEYMYRPDSNTYLRRQGGALHRDGNTDEIIAPKNIVVMRANHFVYQQQGGYLQFDLESGGKCDLYQNGEEIDCTWQKGDETEPLIFKDSEGKVLPMVIGPTWIQVVLPTADVTWQPTFNEPSGQ